MPRKFDFISPGILLNEVDESVLPAVTQDEGPLIIGRSLTGPSMKPVRVKNLEDLYAIFGYPVSGKGAIHSDVWRDGNLVAPTHAMFAAQAHLASNTTPVTFMRLVGEHSDDADAEDYAGWGLSTNIAAETDDAGDMATAYGLFIAPSGSNVQGTLGAIIYASGSSLELKGTDPDTALDGIAGAGATSTIIAASTLVQYQNGDNIVLSIDDGISTAVEFEINFTDTNENYIRNRLNTNPQKMNASNNFNGDDSTYFLGETFELAVEDKIGTGDFYAVIAPLHSDLGNNFITHRKEAQQGETGWFINRTIGGANAQLFKFKTHSAGEFASSNYHIEIADLRMGNELNPNSSFTVKIMKGNVAIETYTGCTLNPSDSNYISKKIGDQYQEWDDAGRKWNARGLYPNKSDYFYVEVHQDVENQVIEDSMPIPVGFEGPVVHPTITLTGAPTTSTLSCTGLADFYMQGTDAVHGGTAGYDIGKTQDAQVITFDFPTVKLTVQNSNQGDNYFPESVFGLRHISDSGVYRDGSYADVTRGGRSVSVGTTKAFTFNLEAMVEDTATGLWYWDESSSAWENKLGYLFAKRVRQFAAPVIGGFEGVNIFNTDPFSSNHVGDSILTSYERYTLDKALNIAADPEVVEFDLLCIPGMTNEAVTNKLISVCETRGDALAIVDFAGIYEPTWVSEGAADPGSVSDVISTAQSRILNSSYAATYYPSIRMMDSAGGKSDVIVAPPSVAAIGAIAKSQAVSEPWFAPAGFNRGGINELGGTQGPRVIGTTEHLSKADRDALYEENINPIARFPASGDIVIFGQKTLQQTPSALDRINVRRLLLYIKRRVGKVSETILFDQNVQATWNRFKSRADVILQDVQARLGIVEYKLVLDETTTTADLVDRNILYAKVLIKPARAIEFIVVDFVVTRSGIEL
jgi:phage tail sheath protein FI